MKFMKKKNKYIEIPGIYCDVIDYNIYKMSAFETVIGALLGYGFVFIASYIMFVILIFSLVLGVVGIPVGIKKYREYLFTKRERQMRVHFKESLQLLTGAYSSGYNIADSFRITHEALLEQFGDKSRITVEFLIIVQGLFNGYSIEELLQNFSDRTTVDDIKNFANTFIVANRKGGNLKQLMVETRDIISEKIDEVLDINTVIHGSKTQVNVLLVMPFVIILIIQSTGFAAPTINLTILITKLIALGLFIAAYFLAKKISSIEV